MEPSKSKAFLSKIGRDVLDTLRSSNVELSLKEFNSFARVRTRRILLNMIADLEDLPVKKKRVARSPLRTK